ncbi:phase 1 flagellin transcriptional repressor, partial [Klebsiella quasipneumoniae]
IEGVSTGMNEQSVGVRLPEGNLIQIFYDWVDRITPI